MYIQGVQKKIGFLSKNFENATPISPALGTGVTVHVANLTDLLQRYLGEGWIAKKGNFSQTPCTHG